VIAMLFQAGIGLGVLNAADQDYRCGLCCPKGGQYLGMSSAGGRRGVRYHGRVMFVLVHRCSVS
jgi:hypothetical protein